jgi:hypothetical protein
VTAEGNREGRGGGHGCIKLVAKETGRDWVRGDGDEGHAACSGALRRSRGLHSVSMAITHFASSSKLSCVCQGLFVVDESQ